MTLLDQYVRTVGLYLRGAAQRDDILSELTEHLHAKIDERKAAQGRALTEPEQASVLAGHGNPMVVAGRYAIIPRSVVFGRQLIGAELFPLYARALVLTIGLSLLVPVISFWADQPPLSHPLRIVFPMLVLFVILTVVFAGMDALQQRNPTPGGRDGWLFPPPYLRPVPRWQSASGLAFVGLLGIWWVSLPYAPVLILGPAAGRLALSPSWGSFYWPVTGLLAAGLTHRIINVVRPTANWLQPAARLVINAVCLAMVYPFLQGHPLVLAVPDALPASTDTIALAQTAANRFWWIVSLGFSTYWLVNVAIFGTICAQHAGYRIRRYRRDPLL